MRLISKIARRAAQKTSGKDWHGTAPDVQTVPVRITVEGAGGPCDIKVDAACRRDGQILVGGWCTSPVDLQLVVDQQPVQHRLFRFPRQDVSTHYKLDYSGETGFVLVGDARPGADVRLRWGDDGDRALSKPLSFFPLAEATASDLHALGTAVDLLGLATAREASCESNPKGAASPASAEKPMQPSGNKYRCGAIARRLVETEPAAMHAVIVGAADGLKTEKVADVEADVFALNGAYFHLVAHGVRPRALVTGDRRFLLKRGIDSLFEVRKVVTFDYALTAEETDRLCEKTIIETFKCAGRDGFSANADVGFFHGCSSFFLAIQYLVSKGYKRISTLGVKFPPPELYSRINGQTGHPEFVYGIQLANLAGLRKELQRHCVAIRALDDSSNLALFL
jgi:hypothetical protein